MTAPDLRTAAQALLDAVDMYGECPFCGSLDDEHQDVCPGVALRAALAVEATEPPPDRKPWTFDVNYEGGPTWTDYGTGVEWDGSYQWAIYDGPHEIDDAVLAGWAPEDPTRVLTALVAEHNRAFGSAPNPQGAAAAALDLGGGPCLECDSPHRFGERCGVPDEPGDDDLTELRRHLSRWVDDGEGWIIVECGCSWHSGPMPTPEDAADAWGDHRAARAIAETAAPIADAARTAGSPPPTSAPTREEVRAVIAGEPSPACDPGDQWLESEYDTLNGSQWSINVDGLTDAVMALLSAEPAPPLWTGVTMEPGDDTYSTLTLYALPVPPGTAVEVREKRP